jgi:hypothetical protein
VSLKWEEVLRYALLFQGLAATPAATDEQTVDYNKRWASWMGELAKAGVLIAGGPFEPRGNVVTAERIDELELQRVDIGGFLLIDADDEPAANAIARAAPHVELGGSTIVRPMIG